MMVSDTLGSFCLSLSDFITAVLVMFLLVIVSGLADKLKGSQK